MTSSEQRECVRAWVPNRLITLLAIMETFDPAKIIWAITGVFNFAQSLPPQDVLMKVSTDAPLMFHKETVYDTLLNRINYLCQELEHLGLKPSLKTARTLKGIFETKFTPAKNPPHPTPFGASDFITFPLINLAEIKGLIERLQTQIVDDLEARVAITIPA